MKRFIGIFLILTFCVGCATSTAVNRKAEEVITSTNRTAWEECCWNDIAPVIIRTPRQRVRINIWVNAWWSNRRGW